MSQNINTATHDTRTATRDTNTATHDTRTATQDTNTATHDTRTATQDTNTATHDTRTATQDAANLRHARTCCILYTSTYYNTLQHTVAVCCSKHAHAVFCTPAHETDESRSHTYT